MNLRIFYMRSIRKTRNKKKKQTKQKQNKTKKQFPVKQEYFFHTDYVWAAILFSSGETGDGGGKREENIF